ncbi:MAG: RNA 2',3'-cyclic phosphodiesterase [Thermodesulfobacteriota bacterium]
MIRLFVAIDLPETIRRDLCLMVPAIPGARAVSVEQLHLTLQFIGEVEEPVMDDINHCLESIEREEFPLRLKGVGHFPPRGKPRILWVGVEKSEELMRLQHRVESSLKRIGLVGEKRKFHPHITLARLKQSPIQRVTSFLGANSLYTSEPFQATSFHLYSSHLGRHGATHILEQSYPLEQP